MRRSRIISVVVLIGLAIGVWVALRPAPLDLPAGITAEEYRRAEAKLAGVLKREPQPAEVWFRIGMDASTSEELLSSQKLTAAAECFRHVDDVHALGPSARMQEGHLWLKHHLAAKAEACYRDVLVLDRTTEVPEAVAATARSFLVYILSVEIRLEDRGRVLTECGERSRPWQSGDLRVLSLNECKQLHFPHMLGLNSEKGRQRLAEFLNADPGNPDLLAAQGRYLTLDGQLTKARDYLEAVVKKHSTPACTAALVDCCYQQNDWERVVELLPGNHEQPEPWIITRVRGQRALQAKDWLSAEENFRRVLIKEPADQESHVGLAAALQGQDRHEERSEILRASAALARIRVEMVRVRENTPEEASALVQLCLEAGLNKAAEDFGWHADRMQQMREGRQ